MCRSDLCANRAPLKENWVVRGKSSVYASKLKRGPVRLWGPWQPLGLCGLAVCVERCRHRRPHLDAFVAADARTATLGGYSWQQPPAIASTTSACPQSPSNVLYPHPLSVRVGALFASLGSTPAPRHGSLTPWALVPWCCPLLLVPSGSRVLSTRRRPA